MRESGGPLRFWLLGGLVVAAAWRPPELDAVGLLLTTALAAGLGVLLVFSGAGDILTERSARLPLLLLAGYLAASLFAASAAHPARSFLAGLVPAGIAFAASRQEWREGGGRTAIETGMVTAASGAALYGLYQALAGLDQTARELRALGLAELDPLVLRAEAGRAFGPFLLPSALGIFLALALPITVRRALESRSRRGAGAMWVTLVVIQLLGMAASRSYGAVLALTGAALLLMAFRSGRRRAIVTLLLIIASAAAGVAIFATRGTEGLSPLALRAGNWKAAGRVFLDHPLLGVGFGNFRDYYPARMDPGMNESAFAHCSYLQAGAEGGIPALLAVLSGAVWLGAGCRRSAGPGPLRGARFLTALPPLAFLLHNIVDFSAYLPSLLIAFTALAGAVPSAGAADPPAGPESRSPATRGAARWLLVAALGGWAAMQVREARVESILEEGKWDLALGRVESALPGLERAAAIDPRHPDPPAILAEALLPGGPANPDRRVKGEGYARHSTTLRPRRAFGHFVLSRYRLSAGDPSEAFVEVMRARELFPSRRQYVEEAERLQRYLIDPPAPETPVHAP